MALGEKGGVGLGEDSLGRWKDAALKHWSAPLLGSRFFLESYHGSDEHHHGSGEHHQGSGEHHYGSGEHHHGSGEHQGSSEHHQGSGHHGSGEHSWEVLLAKGFSSELLLSSMVCDLGSPKDLRFLKRTPSNP